VQAVKGTGRFTSVSDDEQNFRMSHSHSTP